MKPVLLSGAQPSGRLHIGNYLGALKHWVELQNTGKYSCYFPIVDLHSLTADFDPNEKLKQIVELAADYIATGLDPKKSVLFLQSAISAHSELAWILSTITPPGELYRMTQYKDKTEHQKETTNVGLLTYPTLMAADILLYDTKFVPVGDDQDQHLELTRTLARKFNTRFGKTFVEPQGLHTKTPRIMALNNPAKKMSKSHPHTCLFLDDTPNEIEKKIKTAVTDSESVVKFDEKNKPGISNLIGIYSGLTDESVEKLERKFTGRNYGEFKGKLIGVVIDHFADFRKKKKILTANSSRLKAILRTGSKKAVKIANKKIAEVKRKIGLSL